MAEAEATQDIRLEHLEKRVDRHQDILDKLTESFAVLQVNVGEMHRQQELTNEILKEGFKVIKICLAIIASIYGVGAIPT